jgi:predicted nuclease with TOPRIM domain
MKDKIKIYKKKLSRVQHEKEDLRKGLDKKEIEEQELKEEIMKMEGENAKI